ncbi:hypothetical protein CI238_06169 [Colletotrichum incanum]|uniref:Uncharacterized protein n=1 Tax=Colletotrichum incanum TaxID=1573173 RepID=A0A162NHK4_COLIC|nr:hypothetical protein CI238_06169 [Colletotrichum incanum]
MGPYSYCCRPILWTLLGTVFTALQMALAQECNYVGGWSLRFPTSSCPQDAPFDCGKAGGLQMRCCPTGLSCAGNGSYDGNYCCPGMNIELTRQCPDSTWSLWAANDTVDNQPKTGAWCCEPGSKGIYRDNGTANYFCTTITVTTLQPSFYWAQALSTMSCSATATPTVVSSTTGSVTSAPSNATVSSSSKGGESAGVSTGAIAGAAVGGVAAVTLICIGVFFYLRKRKRSRFEVTQALSMSEERNQRMKRHRSGGRRVSELETVEPRLEMDGTKPTYELDATAENIQDESLSPTSTRPR